MTSSVTNEDDTMQVEVTFMMEEDHDVLMHASDEGQCPNLNNDHVNITDKNEVPLTFYEWLADSATTPHISHLRKAFVTYTPLTGKTIAGVGNIEAKVEGQGTIEL